MQMSRTCSWFAALGLCLALNACARPAAETAAAEMAAKSEATTSPTTAATPAAAAKPMPMPMPRILVHHSPTCGCCGLWVEHLRQSGFAVEVRKQDDLEPIKQRLGVPDDKRSCHTGEVEGYFIEGHVPAKDIHRLLTERPTAKGLTLPGMPAGSPGMEMPDGHVDDYVVEQVNADGSARPYSEHRGTRAP